MTYSKAKFERSSNLGEVPKELNRTFAVSCPRSGEAYEVSRRVQGADDPYCFLNIVIATFLNPTLIIKFEKFSSSIESA